MPPAGDEPNRASLNVAFSLRDYEKRTGSGRVYGDGAGFHVNLPHRESFGPDAAYHVGPRTGMRFLEGAPIISPAEHRSCGMWTYCTRTSSSPTRPVIPSIR